MSSQKTVIQYLISGSFWAIAGKIATATANLCFVAVLSRNLSSNEMSAFFLGQSIATFIAITGRFGIENTLLRLIAEYRSQKQYAEIRAILNKGLFIVLVSSSLCAFVYYLIGSWISLQLFSSLALGTIVGFVSGWIMILSFQFVYAEIFRGFQSISHSVCLGGGLFSSLSIALLFGALMLDMTISLYLALVVLLFSGVVNTLVGYFFIRKKQVELPCSEQGKSVSSSYLLAKSWPLWLNALTLFVLSQSGLWILGTQTTGIELAGFGAAMRLILLASMSLVIANLLIPPLIAKYNVQNQKSKLEKMMRTVATLSAAPALFVFSVFLLFPEFLLITVFGEGYDVSAKVLIILVLSEIVSVLVGSCGYALIMTGNSKVIMVISAFSAFIAVFLGAMLVNRYGGIGVAWAIFMAITTQQIAMLVMVKIKVGIWTHVGMLDFGLILSKLKREG